MNRRQIVTSGSVIALVLALVTVPTAFAGGKVSSNLRDKARPESSEKVDVIVTFERGARAAAENKIRGLGAVRRSFVNFPMVAISVPAHALENMAKTPGSSI